MTKPLCLPQFRPRHPTATSGTTTRVLSRRISEIGPLRVREKKQIRPLGTMPPLLLTSPPLFRPAPKSWEGGGVGGVVAGEQGKKKTWLRDLRLWFLSNRDVKMTTSETCSRFFSSPSLFWSAVPSWFVDVLSPLSGLYVGVS